ncbi:MAG TPA: DUF349 domain-containing protein [Kofleriaceae bacterium]|jgi:hypothetical protein|nr:DUF349 domain-containing protein [Kofleriaceae bacterium]
MGIADFFRPKYRHSDVRVRVEAVRALTSDDAAILVQVAKSDRDIGVRRLAIGKIHEADVLAELAAAESERSLRDFAGERAAELWQDTACGANEASASSALSGIVKLGDQHALVEIAANAALPAIRKRAFGELRDPRALAELAKSDAAQDLRLAAVAHIDDGDVLRALAIDTTQKEVGLAAVDKLDDIDRLEHVSQKAKNKAVRQRARKIAAEMADAERAKTKQAVPDEVKRRRAERAQLLREVDAVVETFDFDKHAPAVTTAQAAWAAIAHPDDPGFAETDDKFKKATERFWKRKEVYAQQARSADELRAVQHDAARERERAAAERAPAPKPEPADDDIVRAPDDDPKREAREAEARARREERDRQRADDDAKRASQDAEREARRKDDAERGAAIATSLVALCDDLEKLDTKDGRAIERALQQAAKAFEQIGKVPADQRDAISDRYTTARGKLVVRVSELREGEDWARFQNVPKAEALIQTAKAMAGEEPSQDLANRLRQLQALWKDVGPMPQRRSKELWEQFKSSCDAVYDKVRGLRAIEAEKFGDVAKIKDALIAEAEALAESTDWAATADKLKVLQARWKESGHLPRKQGDELWKRFRAACDRFFERRKPQLDARHAEEGDNLAKKQQLIARAQQIADGAPGEGGWGKAIGAIKDLQREWKDIGFVPRRDADAVYAAFRAACDVLFAKRDSARDGEANAHRADVDAIVVEIAAVEAGGEDRVNRAIAVRAKARELEPHDARELAGKLEAMVRAVIANEQVAGTELDPAALHARRAKLIAKAEELLPKQASTAAGGADIAAQLAQAMRANAFGDLRFSGRDPIEVVDELRAQWTDAGPLLDEADRAQAATFDDVCKRVLDAAGASAKREAREAREAREERPERGERDRGDRRRRRERHSAEQPIANPAPASAAPIAITPDVPTAPARIPFEPLPAPPVPPEPPRRVTATLPPMDELDTGWDLDGEDPTADKTEAPSPPSSDEMASDGATGGDGIDEPGWD